MKQSDFNDFCDLLSLIAEQYQKPVSEGAMMLYFQGLIDFEFEAVKQALFRHIRNPDNGQFMPKIADIIRMMQGSTKDSAMVAWTKVDYAVRCVGTQVSVTFDDEIIHAVIDDMGGWASFGRKTNDEWPFVARDFESRYRAYKQTGEAVKHSPVLGGLYDSVNLPNGFQKQQPVLVGDKEKAKQVMLSGNETQKLMITQGGNFQEFSNVLSLKKA
jgi:hypothetical protein